MLETKCRAVLTLTEAAANQVAGAEVTGVFDDGDNGEGDECL